MSRAAELLCAILREHHLDDRAALDIIDDALESEVDPLVYCAQHFGLGEILVQQRAAAWLGVAFADAVPVDGATLQPLRHIDGLGTVCSMRITAGDSETLFCAPTFLALLRLKPYLQANPHAVSRMHLVTRSAIVNALAVAAADRLLDESRQRLVRKWPFATAHLDLPYAARAIFVAGLVIITATAVLPFDLSLLFLPASLFLLLAPALLRLFAVGLADGDVVQPAALPESDLPVYSVLIPLRDEAAMVPQLARSMLALDYPREKLDIKFIVEATSPDTIRVVENIVGHGPFQMIVVPDAPPRTKPKALNFALPFVRGEFLVVYDAEDIPDPDQLRIAAQHFAAEPGISCLQAALVIDNGAENALTAMFASEYAGLFSVMLPALAKWNLPMPLGGTSNHFRVNDLKSVGGWDGFNVTEDADLGIRLARLRYRSAILASETREEAPVTLRGWMRQRTRWMKGWMTTLIVHNRRPRQFLADLGWRNFLAFEIYMGGILLAPLLHTVFILVALARLTIPGFGTTGGGYWALFNAFVLATGYCGAVAMVIKGLYLRKQARLLAYQLLLPLYWMLHSIATARALVELLHSPYFWAKTSHGQTSMARHGAVAEPHGFVVVPSVTSHL